MHPTTITHQDATRNLATNWGDPWERDDIVTVVEYADAGIADVDIAIEMGRTLYAVWSILHRVRSEGVDNVVASFARRVDNDARRVDNAPTFDFVTTFPPGWNE